MQICWHFLQQSFQRGEGLDRPLSGRGRRRRGAGGGGGNKNEKGGGRDFGKRRGTGEDIILGKYDHENSFLTFSFKLLNSNELFQINHD